MRPISREYGPGGSYEFWSLGEPKLEIERLAEQLTDRADVFVCVCFVFCFLVFFFLGGGGEVFVFFFFWGGGLQIESVQCLEARNV